MLYNVYSYKALYYDVLNKESLSQAQIPTMPKVEFSPVQAWNSGKNWIRSLFFLFPKIEYKLSSVLSLCFWLPRLETVVV